MQNLAVIDEPAVASAILDPVRSQILAALRTPGSATTVADQLGLTRQKVNYHLRTLESHGLVRLVEERPRRGLTERIMVASARSYLVSPSVLNQSTTEPPTSDRLSADYLLATAARTIREVAELAELARKADKTLATLTIDADVRFSSAADRAAFTAELTEVVTALVAKYHDNDIPDGRWHRLAVTAHPRPAPHISTLKETSQ